MNTPSNGVLYIATGPEFIKEAVVSARSLKQTSGDLHTTLFTDREVHADCFDEVRQFEGPAYDFSDSILGSSMTPYDRTLFIDTDTYVCEDISGIFELLDRFDIAAAHNPGSRTARARDGYAAEGIPDAFPEYNTGVVLYRDTQAVADFFEKWKKTYRGDRDRTTSKLNQPSFREELYKSSLDIATLPSEYNLRVRYKGSVGFMTDPVKIVHGRHPAGLPTVAKRLNAKTGMRVFTMKGWPVEVSTKSPGLRYYIPALLTEDPKEDSFRERFLSSIRDRGIADTLSRVAGYLSKTRT